MRLSEAHAFLREHVRPGLQQEASAASTRKLTRAITELGGDAFVINSATLDAIENLTPGLRSRAILASFTACYGEEIGKNLLAPENVAGAVEALIEMSGKSAPLARGLRELAANYERAQPARPGDGVDILAVLESPRLAAGEHDRGFDLETAAARKPVARLHLVGDTWELRWTPEHSKKLQRFFARRASIYPKDGGPRYRRLKLRTLSSATLLHLYEQLLQAKPPPHGPIGAITASAQRAVQAAMAERTDAYEQRQQHAGEVLAAVELPNIIARTLKLDGDDPEKPEPTTEAQPPAAHHDLQPAEAPTEPPQTDRPSEPPPITGATVAEVTTAIEQQPAEQRVGEKPRHWLARLVKPWA